MTSQEPFRPQYLVALNALSVFRGLLGISLPFLLFVDRPDYHLWAFALFIFGAITDYLDGMIARRFSLVTAFGKFIDPVMDKILILSPLCAFGIKDFYSIWWAVPIFIREVVITFIRIGWAMEGSVIAAENLGKLKFGSQVAAVVLSFFALFSTEHEFLAAWQTPFHQMLMLALALSVGFTIISGITLCINNRKLFQSDFFAKFVSAVGVGFIPPIPGTLGSLLGLLIVLFIRWNSWLYASTLLVLIVAGYWSVSRINLSRDKDPNYVVIDEVCGMLVTMAGIPINCVTLVTGFFLFRIFDITKPFPIRRFERLPGYWGILCDDLAAGLLAQLMLLIFISI